MPAYSEISNLLTQALGLAQPPIAVCLTDSVPAGVALWEGHAPAGCRFWQEAATRVFATTAADHGLCSIGLYTHNLGLSPAATAEVAAAIRTASEADGVAVLLVEQNAEVACNLCDRVAFMDSGELTWVGPPDEARRRALAGGVLT